MESRGGEFLLLSYPGLPTYTVKKQHMVRPSLSLMKPAKAYRDTVPPYAKAVRMRMENHDGDPI